MTIVTKQLSVGSPASLVFSADSTINKRLIINNSGSSLYIGGDSSVTDTDGFPINDTETLNISDYVGSVYGYASSSITVEVIENS